MKIIAIHVQKGGVGKTTLTGNMGFELSRQGKKVLLLDLDASQGQLSSWLLTEKPEFELGDFLFGDCKLHETINPVRENLWISACFGIRSSLKKWMRREGQEMGSFEVIKSIFDQAEAEGMDYVICDMSPAMTHFEKLILMNVDEVINVFDPEGFSIDGLSIFTEEVQDVVKERAARSLPPLLIEKAVINKIHSTYSTHNQILEAFRQKDKVLLLINYNRKIADSVLINKFAREVGSGKRTENQLDQLTKGVI